MSLSNALPLNGRTAGEISDALPSYFHASWIYIFHLERDLSVFAGFHHLSSTAVSARTAVSWANRLVVRCHNRVERLLAAGLALWFLCRLRFIYGRACW